MNFKSLLAAATPAPWTGLDSSEEIFILTDNGDEPLLLTPADQELICVLRNAAPLVLEYMQAVTHYKKVMESDRSFPSDRAMAKDWLDDAHNRLAKELGVV